MALSQVQLLSIVLIVKCTAILSFCGSTYIAQEVLRDPRKRKMVYHRLLLAMSLSDMSSSCWMFIGNWAIPEGTEGVFQPRGNQISCNTQGFFVQLGIMTPLYNASLSLYYLLIINYGWKEASLRKIEPYFHLLSLFWGVGTAILGLAWNQYHNSNLWCWLSSTKETKILRWALYYGPVWLILIFVAIAMVMVCQHVYSQEKTLDKYDFSSSKKERRRQSLIKAKEMKHRKQSKRVAAQSFWYVFAFYLAFIFASLTRLIQTINGKTYYLILLLFAIFFPMQGFMNFLVYLRPRYLKYFDKSRNIYRTRSTTSSAAAINNNIIPRLTSFRVSYLSSIGRSNISSSIISIGGATSSRNSNFDSMPDGSDHVDDEDDDVEVSSSSFFPEVVQHESLHQSLAQIDETNREYVSSELLLPVQDGQQSSEEFVFSGIGTENQSNIDIPSCRYRGENCAINDEANQTEANTCSTSTESVWITFKERSSAVLSTIEITDESASASIGITERFNSEVDGSNELKLQQVEQLGGSSKFETYNHHTILHENMTMKVSNESSLCDVITMDDKIQYEMNQETIESNHFEDEETVFPISFDYNDI